MASCEGETRDLFNIELRLNALQNSFPIAHSEGQKEFREERHTERKR